MIYYTYSSHSTRERANDALETYFACGEVSEGERPRIRQHKGRWLVEFLDTCSLPY